MRVGRSHVLRVVREAAIHGVCSPVPGLEHVMWRVRSLWLATVWRGLTRRDGARMCVLCVCVQLAESRAEPGAGEHLSLERVRVRGLEFVTEL
eukprot:5640139-Prymnesium_polylepis.1